MPEIFARTVNAEFTLPAMLRLPERFKLALAILPNTDNVVPVYKVALTLPPVMLPVADTVPPVLIFPPVTLAVVTTGPVKLTKLPV